MANILYLSSHRISSIKDADQILVVLNGSIAEHGTHDELVAQNGYYATVFNHQYGDFDAISALKSSLKKSGSEENYGKK